ncbi:hypothetical protein [Streptomyces sp. NPDC012510]|uniref:hypothetical protein n=1 Tax=Streptomyces sp. NPDC012510 TaxID=3364838 RepID=UPI0036EC9E05
MAAPATGAAAKSATGPVTAVVDTLADVTGTAGRAVPPVGAHVVEPVVEHVVQPVTEQVVRPVTDSVVRPVTDPVLRPITQHVVVPIGDLVETVTEGLTEAPTRFPPVSGTPPLPGAPGIPEEPELPELPGWSTLPVEIPPFDVTPVERGRAEVEAPGSTVTGDHDCDGDGDCDGAGEWAADPETASYGPHVSMDDAVSVSAARRDAGAGDAPVVRVPERPDTDALPASTLGHHSTVDNGGPRHAEPYAVASFDRVPLSLVPVATAVDAAYDTRERHRDIPESPG